MTRAVSWEVTVERRGRWWRRRYWDGWWVMIYVVRRDDQGRVVRRTAGWNGPHSKAEAEKNAAMNRQAYAHAEEIAGRDSP